MAQMGSGSIVLRVASERYAEDHPAWRSHVSVLGNELMRLQRRSAAGHDRAPVLRLETQATDPQVESGAPTKGAVELSLELLSVEVIRAVSGIIRDWLQQDKSRNVSIEVKTANFEYKGSGSGADGIRAVTGAFQEVLGELNDST